MLSLVLANADLASSSVFFIRSVNSFTALWRLVWFEAHLRVSASVKEEWRLLCGGVYVVIVHELCEWEERVPIVLSFPNKDI